MDTHELIVNLRPIGIAATNILRKDEPSLLRLQLEMGRDEKGRMRSAQLSVREEGQFGSFGVLTSKYPFKVEREEYLEVLRLVNFLNQSLPMGTFFLDEEKGIVVWNCSVPLGRETSQYLVAWINTCMLWIDGYGAWIEEAAEGKKAADVISSRLQSL